jgi:hypothetical protein
MGRRSSIGSWMCHPTFGVYDSLQSAGYSCIADQIDVPSDVFQGTADYLSRRPHTYFEDVATTAADGAAQQRWLTVTAERIAVGGNGSGTLATADSRGMASEQSGTATSDDSPGLVALAGRSGSAYRAGLFCVACLGIR